MSKRCPESVKKKKKTPETLSGHLLDTLQPGDRRAPRRSPDTLSDTPIFGDASLGDSPGHFGPEGPEASCRGLGMSQGEGMSHNPSSGMYGRHVRFQFQFRFLKSGSCGSGSVGGSWNNGSHLSAPNRAIWCDCDLRFESRIANH